MQIETLKLLFKTYKETSLFGRYIHAKNIDPLLEKLKDKMQIKQVGKSVNGVPIHTVTFGSGGKKILMWSQMHGNESTTTKAVFDLLNLFSEENEITKAILKACTVTVIPILNPDGAKLYTRLNANKVDLNRDAQKMTQPESRVLRNVFNDLKPDFCYNLHGQRTIFSAGKVDKPATISFLAPAQDEDRTITSTRKIAMEVISVMNSSLQLQIPGQVGIYDDGFNINCVGDTFQAENVPTILFEAGHYVNDYHREHTRAFIFQSLLVSLDYIASRAVVGSDYQSYLEIPQNDKLFYDIIIRNTSHRDIAIQYVERLEGSDLVFVPKIEKISDMSHYFAHCERDANGCEVFGENSMALQEGLEIDFVIINKEKLSLKV
ncbi:M14 family metallopeptidase [Psychroserpens damuponensis]|uniref:M14 family metallopeptidase n=1 Tax=Psychroserpens damuponensis TaxID=943936 RepID=UPI00058AED65|nr:M14 metallopeptidase family protein [Psychroserpens damuponensis]